MPQRAIATAGVEWDATDMTFDQDGRDLDFLKRTIFQMGNAGGVLQGGVVADGGGFVVTITGPLHFTVRGELAEVTSPGPVTLAASNTYYVIARFETTDDTPATYFGGGTPPFKHRNLTPTVFGRLTPAVTNDYEIPLATVVTNGGGIASITDTRVTVPTVTAGNIVLGAGNTVDGVDPSAHVLQTADDSTLAHVRLQHPNSASFGIVVGKAARANLAVPFYTVQVYHHDDLGHVPDFGDFTPPPDSETLGIYHHPSLYGEFWMSGSGPKWIMRCIMDFEASNVSPDPINALMLAVNSRMRVKLNGSTIYTFSSTDETGANFMTLNPVQGTNTLELYFGNGAAEYTFQFLTSFLVDNQFEFSPNISYG